MLESLPFGIIVQPNLLSSRIIVESVSTSVSDESLYKVYLISSFELVGFIVEPILIMTPSTTDGID